MLKEKNAIKILEKLLSLQQNKLPLLQQVEWFNNGIHLGDYTTENWVGSSSLCFDKDGLEETIEEYGNGLICNCALTCRCPPRVLHVYFKRIREEDLERVAEKYQLTKEKIIAKLPSEIIKFI